jgi:hypothetical protein
MKTAPLLKMEVYGHARTYVFGVLSQTNKMNYLQELINSYESVFVVGAGLSFESKVPLAKHLYDLLAFCMAQDYRAIRDDDDKCYKFKFQFKSICDRKQTSISHKLISEYFPKKIKDIICLNWDNLIEKAALEQCKNITKINEGGLPTDSVNYLWKFHGDVDNIKRNNIKGKGGWVFPDEKGYIFDSFISYANRSGGLNDTLFTLVILGYSEGDKNISDIIQTLEKDPPRPTFRVGLDLRHLHEDKYIVGPSDFVLPEILRP